MRIPDYQRACATSWQRCYVERISKDNRLPKEAWYSHSSARL